MPQTGAEHADMAYLASLQLFSNQFVSLLSSGLGETLLWFLYGPYKVPKDGGLSGLLWIESCQGPLSGVLFFTRSA